MRREVRKDLQDGDQSLSIMIREMPALQGAVWLSRFLIMLARTDLQINFDGDAAAILEQLLSPETLTKIIGSLEWRTAEPLLMELFTCVSRIPLGGGSPVPMADREMINGMIQSPLTVFKIWAEVMKHNFGFFSQTIAGAQSGSRSNTTSQQGTQTEADIKIARKR